MSEKRFTIHKESKYKEEWYDYPFCIKEDGEVVINTIPLSIALKVRDKLNEQQDIIKSKDSLLSILAEENEQLRKELGDCEKFRYTVFKRLNEEYIKECSIK